MPEQTHLLSLLLVIPLAFGVLSLAFVQHVPLCRALGVTSLISMLVGIAFLLLRVTGSEGAESVLVAQSGSWPAPWGISLVFDRLSGMLVAATVTVALACYIYSFSTLSPEVERRYFHPLYQFIVLGVTLSFLTGDLFNLFVAFEVMLMASYALLTLGLSRPQLANAYKYVLVNLLASGVFVAAAGMTYGMTGTLNMADLARIVSEARLHDAMIQASLTPPEAVTPLPTGFTALGVTLLLVFGTKAALFPLWFWLPDTYWTAPAPILAFFGGVLTKVGIYALARLYPMAFAAGDETGYIVFIFTVAAGFTMLLGVMGALGYHRVRRILCMQLIVGVGYMLLGLASMTPDGLGGTVFYMLHSMVLTAALFLAGCLIERHTQTDNLKQFAGLLQRDGKLALMIFVGSITLIGLPPLSGFFGKAMVIRESWATGNSLLAITALVVGALTLFSLMRLWSRGFWGELKLPITTDPKTIQRVHRPAYAATAGLLAVGIALSVFAGPVMQQARLAGEQLHNPTDYIEAVLGEQGTQRINAMAETLDEHNHSRLNPYVASREEAHP